MQRLCMLNPVIVRKTRREEIRQKHDGNKDGKIMSKNGKIHYGYKLHTIMDTTHDLIRRIETTTANVHDSQVDLSEKGEVVYRDRGYQGAKCKGYSATMKRGAMRASHWHTR